MVNFWWLWTILFVLLCTTEYYKVKRNTAKYYSVLPIRLRTRKQNKIGRNITKYYKIYSVCCKELLRTTRYYCVLLYTAEKIYEKLQRSPVYVLPCSSKYYMALLRATSKTRYYKDLQGLKHFKVLLHTTQYYVYYSILSTTLQSGTRPKIRW